MVTVEFAKGKIIVSEEKYFEASKKVFDEFISKEKGFISWEVLKDNEGFYIDLLHWEALEDAQRAAQKFMEQPCCQTFFPCFDKETVSMQHFEVVKKY